MQRIRRRVGKMAVAVRTETTTKEQIRARAHKLSDILTKTSIAAGITQEQLEKETRKAFLHVKRSRRFGRS